MRADYSFLFSTVTFACSIISLVGSMLVLFSYLVARVRSNARSAELIRNLAITDFIWFTCSLLISAYWLFAGDPGHVPDGICWIAAPILLYLRMASLLWTCAISYDVLMSVRKRKWLWSDQLGWMTYHKNYSLFVYLIPLPGALQTIIQSIMEGSPMGCEDKYEPMDSWVATFFVELLPISLAFFFNIYVFLKVRSKMSLKAYPQSVRKKRRRIMYHYVVVCIICWTPTMFFYIFEMAKSHHVALELFARMSLYLTGFLNFIVFGLQDPHLKKSFHLVVFFLGLKCLLDDSDSVKLKDREIDKNVCFEEASITENADIFKGKKDIYRHHTLSVEEKLRLYESRPDLMPLKKEKIKGNKELTQPLLSDSESETESTRTPSYSSNLESSDNDPMFISSSNAEEGRGQGMESDSLDPSREVSVSSTTNWEEEGNDILVVRQRCDSNDLARNRLLVKQLRESDDLSSSDVESRGSDADSSDSASKLRFSDTTVCIVKSPRKSANPENPPIFVAPSAPELVPISPKSSPRRVKIDSKSENTGDISLHLPSSLSSSPSSSSMNSPSRGVLNPLLSVIRNESSSQTPSALTSNPNDSKKAKRHSKRKNKPSDDSSDSSSADEADEEDRRLAAPIAVFAANR